MPKYRISGREFNLDSATVEDYMGEVLPDPLREHYVVVGGLRYPPKQVIACATGLDRADFTTHQARRVLKRLGFVAARLSKDGHSEGSTSVEGLPHDGRQAAALEPFIGKWVALASPTEILVAADTPQDVLAWLARHERRAPLGMFRVPASAADAEGLAPL